MRSNINQVKTVWARIHLAIHTKRPFILFSSHYQILQIIVKYTLIHQRLVIWQKKLAHHTNLAAPIPWEGQKPYHSNKILSCNPSKLPFRQVRSWGIETYREVNTQENWSKHWRQHDTPTETLKKIINSIYQRGKIWTKKSKLNQFEL